MKDPITSRNTRKEVSHSLNEESISFDLKRALPDPATFRRKLIAFASEQDVACILNNNYPTEHNSAPIIAGIGIKKELKLREAKGAFSALRDFSEELSKELLMGFFSYDLKNDVEALESANIDGLGFPELHFFLPRTLIIIDGEEVRIRDSAGRAEEVLQSIDNQDIDTFSSNSASIQFESHPPEQEYISIVNDLIGEIHQGNIYEINYCREMLAKAKLNVVETALALDKSSPAPFSVYYKVDGKHLICASPERFLKKTGSTLISQPIKGTIHRSSDHSDDEDLKRKLYEDKKERAENVMIVDLVRNDLSHTAKRGSVKVEELFGIHTFAHVHQMISTVQSELKEDVHFVEAIRHCFPMGSMTGAPKLRAMKLIEEKEQFKRGIFSGSVGMITPERDFDFNVVIRSILYDEKTENLSIRTGSAITSLCIPEKEWNECNLKAKALLKALRLKE